jgi:hypothetical protein
VTLTRNGTTKSKRPFFYTGFAKLHFVFFALLFTGKVSSFVTVFIAHRTFVYKPKQQMRAAEAAAAAGNVPPPHYIQGPSDSIAWGCLRSIPGFDTNVHVTTIVLRYEEIVGSESSASFVVSPEEIAQTGEFRSNNCNECALSDMLSEDGKGENTATCTIPYEVTRRLNATDENKASSCFQPSDRALYSYSQTKGYLLLPESTRDQHNILTQYAVIPLSDTKCFGESFLQSLVVNVMGTDTIVLNWLLGLHNGDGYMYREPPRVLVDPKHETHTKPMPSTSSTHKDAGMDVIARAEDKLIDLRFASDYLLMHSLSKASPSTSFCRKLDRFIVFKLGVLLINIFLFCVTTTLVSFTLRETQERMVDFTFLLQSHIRQRLPYVQLVFKHVVESLVFVPITVGTIFFLIEIFEDQFLAIMVLTLVWICEVFSAIG